MTSKEIVTRSIEQKHPPRLSINYCNRDFEWSDTKSITYYPPTTFAPDEEGMSEWGYVWERLDTTMGQPRSNPLADWRRFDSYDFPDPSAAGRFDHLPEIVEGHSDLFLKGVLGISGFNQATFLRGFEQFLVDLYDAPDRATAILDAVFGFETSIIRRFCDFPIDAIAFGDDWGTQRGLIVSPAEWRRHFLHRYAEQFELIHNAGKKVWFHTCGDVYDIIELLIEIGVDVLELLQPEIFGLERLAEEFGGRVCFCCAVDHQRIAINGTREEIFTYAERLHNTLGRHEGGFIAYIEDYASLGMSEQNYQWIREAFHSIAGTDIAGSAEVSNLDTQ